jgi:hypothetical protein
VHLGDLPANVSGRRLGGGVFRAVLVNLGLLTTAAAGAIAGDLMHTLPGMTAHPAPLLMSQESDMNS